MEVSQVILWKLPARTKNCVVLILQMRLGCTLVASAQLSSQTKHKQVTFSEQDFKSWHSSVHLLLAVFIKVTRMPGRCSPQTCVCVWAHFIFQEDLSGCCLFDITRVDRRDDNTVITLLYEWNEYNPETAAGSSGPRCEESLARSDKHAENYEATFMLIFRAVLLWLDISKCLNPYLQH